MAPAGSRTDASPPVVPPKMGTLAKVTKLRFAYSGCESVLEDVDFEVKSGERILLIGANGSGKSSFLRVFSGFHLAHWERFELYGEPTGQKIPWCDQHNGLAYLGGQWTQKSGFAVTNPFAMDRAAGDMMADWQEEFKERRDVLARVLGVNLNWRMHRVSDGQRKKVRIMLKLLRPFRVCVMDEFAVELDVLSRNRLMKYLANECATRGAAVIYCTHIFDNLDDWATHVTFLKSDKTITPVHELATFPPYQKYAQEKDAGIHGAPLYRLVMSYLVDQATQNGGVNELEEGDMNEAEYTAKREFNPFDGGFETGRSQLMFAARGDPGRLTKEN